MSESSRSSGSDWALGNAEQQHQQHPRSFFIPGREERERLAAGDDVQLLFELTERDDDQPGAERMWLEIVSRDDLGYVGVLKNTPAAIQDLAAGNQVRFGPEHVISVDNPQWRPFEDKLAFVSARLLGDEAVVPMFVRHDPEDEGKTRRATGDVVSGWELYVGDETDEELAQTGNVKLPNLAWLMERYPAFGDLVFSGARDGEWELVDGVYRLSDPGGREPEHGRRRSLLSRLPGRRRRP